MNDLRHFMPAYALAFVFATPAYANPLQTGIDEIVVTATRRPVASADISSALSVVHNDELSAVKIVTDALSSRPASSPFPLFPPAISCPCPQSCA
jgi:outer membrane receptor protein involved in Fe transport